MVGKGSKITQSQRCSVGVGVPPLWPLSAEFLKGSGERLLSRKLGAAVEKGPLASQPKLL